MEFRLVYRGPLPAAGDRNTRKADKHAIRKYLHPQLKEWFRQRASADPAFGDPNEVANRIAKNFSRCGFNFVPIIALAHTESCAIDLLFLRRDAPGNLVKTGGDIDNRIKVLFDGLKLPQECSEVTGAAPGEGEDPFFCLLQDDKIITEINITTDRLLVPYNSADNNLHHVQLIIRVRADTDLLHTSPYHGSRGNGEIDI